MSRTRTIRWITLAVFCLLLTTFILYRAGRLDKYIFYNSSRQHSAVNTGNTGNTPSVNDSLGMIVINGLYIDRVELLSSSKSIKLVEPAGPMITYFVDTLPGSVYDSVDIAIRDLTLSSGADTAFIMNPRTEWHKVIRVQITYRDSVKLKKYIDSVKKTTKGQ